MTPINRLCARQSRGRAQKKHCPSRGGVLQARERGRVREHLHRELVYDTQQAVREARGGMARRPRQEAVSNRACFEGFAGAGSERRRARAELPASRREVGTRAACMLGSALCFGVVRTWRPCSTRWRRRPSAGHSRRLCRPPRPWVCSRGVFAGRLHRTRRC